MLTLGAVSIFGEFLAEEAPLPASAQPLLLGVGDSDLGLCAADRAPGLPRFARSSRDLVLKERTISQCVGEPARGGALALGPVDGRLCRAKLVLRHLGRPGPAKAEGVDEIPE